MAGEAVLRGCERDGTQVVEVAPGEAHEKLDICETHGGWFERLLARVIEGQQVATKEDWLEAVDAVADGKNRLVRRAGHSPYQWVFGRDPPLPEDLMDSSLSLMTNSAVLNDEEFARRACIRQAARVDTLASKDDRAMRMALDARPRVRIPFQPGDMVAFWRSGKGRSRRMRARWRGLAYVVAEQRGNFILSFGGQWLLAAPWQLRHGTPEERRAATLDADL